MMTFRQELEIILKELLDVAVKLKEISLEKTEYIIQTNIEEIEKLTKIEENLINNMGTIENRRLEILDVWGVGKDTPISDIIDRLTEDNSDLILIRDEMINVFEELKIRNDLNNDLIRENLDWIDFNINLITTNPGESNYGDEKGSSKGKSIFDRKV